MTFWYSFQNILRYSSSWWSKLWRMWTLVKWCPIPISDLTILSNLSKRRIILMKTLRLLLSVSKQTTVVFINCTYHVWAHVALFGVVIVPYLFFSYPAIWEIRLWFDWVSWIIVATVQIDIEILAVASLWILNHFAPSIIATSMLLDVYVIIIPISFLTEVHIFSVNLYFIILNLLISFELILNRYLIGMLSKF